MSQVLIIILICVGVALLALGVLIVAAVVASRSKRGPAQNTQTPTQQVDNPYRKIYK